MHASMPDCPKCHAEMQFLFMRHARGPDEKYHTIRLFQCKCGGIAADELTEVPVSRREAA